MSTSPIMTLFREFATKYRQAGDVSYEEEVASGLLDECRVLERRMMAIPSTSAPDLAAKIIAETRYGDFCISDPGEGGVYDEALALLADYQHPDAKLIELGQQFEAVKNEARKLEVEWRRSRAVFEAACQEAGISEDTVGYYASRSIARRTGHDKAYNTFSKEHSKAIKLTRAIHRAKASTIEGYAVRRATRLAHARAGCNAMEKADRQGDQSPRSHARGTAASIDRRASQGAAGGHLRRDRSS